MTDNNIVMIGMPGAGKSTVGVVLAKMLGMDFVDVDLVICRREGGNLQAIVDRHSHADFLRIEAEAAKSLNCQGSVIATGGSMVLSPDAMEHLSSSGVVVYIKTPLENIKKRIRNPNSRGIAFLPGETLDDIYAKRTPLYEKWADITVSCGETDTIEGTALRIKSDIDGK